MLLLGIGSMWATDIYSVSLGSQVTDLATLSSDKYYVLKNYGSGRYNCFDDTHNRLEAMSGINYTCVVKLLYSDGKVQIQQVQTGTYYQALAASRVSLGSNAVDFTFNTDGVDAGQFRFASGDYFMNRAAEGNQYPTGVSKSMTGPFSRWLIYEVTVTSLVSNGNLYKMDFVSKNGNTKWGLSASAPVSGANTGSTFVAHEYTNTNGDTRWIFVNNDNGNYLGYKTEDNAFNISKPVHEFTIGYINPGMDYVFSDADCTNKFYITATNRSTSSTDAGCYILNESTGAYDNSSGPYYNGSHTSALTFTATGNNVSSAATLAIAKFEALYEVKDYLSYAGNITALFANPSSIEANINAAESTSAAAAVATNFMKSPEGKKFYAVNSTATSQFLKIDSDKVKATDKNLSSANVMEVEYAGNGRYYIKGVKSTRYAQTPSESANISTSEKGSAETFYIGNAGSTDNQVYFSNKRSDSGNYGSIHYNSNLTHYVVGWTYSAGASKWNITYISDADYTILDEAEEDEITCTLTDMNGTEYDITYSAAIGTKPTLAGCDNYTLSNEVWDYTNRTYTATITFPFNVSSGEVTNWIYIYNINSGFKWHVESDKATRVIVQKDTWPKYSYYTRYEWAVYPSISSDGANVTFTIKNHCTDKYITSTSTSQSHSGVVTLSDSGTPLTYIQDGAYPRWCLPTTLDNDGNTKLELSVNSSGSTDIQELGTYTVHNGTSSWPINVIDDFATLYTNLKSACTAFSPYRYLIGDGLGKYSGANSSLMITYFDEITIGTDPTAAVMRAWITALENPATKLTLNLPTTEKFYRIKGYSNNYMTSNTAGNNASMNGTASADNIVYYSADRNLIFYGSDSDKSGLGLYNTCYVAPVGSTLNQYTFSEGAQMSHYYVRSNASGIGTYCYDNTANGTKVDRNTNPVTSGSYQTDWTLEEVTSLPLKLAANSYTSFSAPVAITIPDNCKAYIAKTKNNNTIKMKEVTGNIPANTGIIIGTGADANPTFTVYNGSDFANCDGNILASNVAASALSRNDNYFFGKQRSTGNYIFTMLSGDGDNYTLYGHKAYLPKENLASVEGARISIIWDDDPTGLNELKDDSMEVKDGKYYQNQKIVVIRNGVKYNVAGQIIK